MSIQQNFPAISPSLNLNFARSKTLDPRITFSRTSTATRVNEQGLVEVVSADIPRFDHEYENGVIKSLGLLVEEQRTNVLEQSVVTTSNWTGSTSNTTYSNLSLNALGIFPGVEVTSTTGAAWHRRTTGFNVPFVSGTEYAVTFYYREGTSGSARLQFRYNSQESYVQGPVNGSAWTIQQTIGSISNVTTTLMDGQSTYKTSYIFTPNFTGDADMGIGVGLEGSAGVTIIALGGQVEAGAFPTSYIPTSGGTATRNPDSVSMTGENFSDWYNQDEGTILASHKTVLQTEPGYARIWSINDGTSNNAYAIYYPNGSKIDGFKKVSGSSNFIGGPLSTGNHNVINKTAFSYDGSAGAVTTNGVTPATYSVSGNLTLSRLNIGAREFNDPTSSIHISQLTYYPRRLTNTQLQNLTK